MASDRQEPLQTCDEAGCTQERYPNNRFCVDHSYVAAVDSENAKLAAAKAASCKGHDHPRPVQHESDKLADILWWIQGRIDADSFEPFDSSHVDALRKHRAYAMYEATGGKW